MTDAQNKTALPAATLAATSISATSTTATTQTSTAPVVTPATKVKSKKLACYVDLLPPCNNACPAGENIQAWLGHAQAGHFKEAWEEIIKNNPMPATHGRVCYHPCESNCNRRQLDSTVNIHATERYIGDMALAEGWQVPATSVAPLSGKKVLVIGAGPAGLSAAYHLRRRGHAVTIYDALSELGGMMYLGIPDYRLPSDILDGEAKRIIAMGGIDVKLNHRVDDVIAEKERGKFDAVFIAVGAYKGRITDCTRVDPCPIWDSIEFLLAVKENKFPKINDLIVYGGSNTAMDVARSARRLGIKNITVCYHRSRQRMAAFPLEVEEALEEGVQLKALHAMQKVAGKKVTFNVVELDASGNPQPTGEVATLDADLVVFSLGQTPATEFLKKIPNFEMKSNGCVIANEATMMTSCAGIFAGGDVLPLDQSVTVATGHGKKAAYNIDAFLQNSKYEKAPKHRIVKYEDMELWFKDKTECTEQTVLDATTRVQSFAEVVGGIDKQQAQYEAKRCLSCGNCFECDSCYAVCPVKAITKLGIGKRYSIDKETCFGCNKCVKQCPCCAIEMAGRE